MSPLTLTKISIGVVGLALLLFNSNSLANVAKPQNRVYFSLADEYGRPTGDRKSQFDCNDKIYTVVELEDISRGRHDTAVRWIDPSDTTREHTRYPFNVQQKPTRIWAWLSLSRATGAGMLQWVNPAAGLEEFIGPWSIEVRIDGKLLSSQSFEVNC